MRVCALCGPRKMAPPLQATQVSSPGRVFLQVHLQKTGISSLFMHTFP